MKVLYVLSRGETLGGAQVHVVDLVRELCRDNDVRVAVGTSGAFTDAIEALDVEVTVIPDLATMRPNPVASRNAITELVGLAEGADLVCLHSTKSSVLGRLAAKRAGVPAIYTVHGCIYTPGLPAARRLMGWLIEFGFRRSVDRFIAVSDFDKSLLVTGRVAEASDVSVVHNSVPDIDSVTPIDTAQPIVILMIARFESQKDHGTLFEALAGLQELDWRLELAGDGPLEAETRDLVRDFGLVDRVEFLGLTTRVAEHLDASSLVVLATNYEGLPLSLLEAMRAARPVIASDVGGVAELVVDGQTGLVVEPANVGALRDAIRQVLSDPDAGAAMGVAGRKRYEDEFSHRRFVAATLEVYDQVVETAGRRGRPVPRRKNR